MLELVLKYADIPLLPNHSNRSVLNQPKGFPQLSRINLPRPTRKVKKQVLWSNNINSAKLMMPPHNAKRDATLFPPSSHTTHK